jgi:hypothetical protein
MDLEITASDPKIPLPVFEPLRALYAGRLYRWSGGSGNKDTGFIAIGGRAGSCLEGALPIPIRLLGFVDPTEPSNHLHTPTRVLCIAHAEIRCDEPFLYEGNHTALKRIPPFFAANRTLASVEIRSSQWVLVSKFLLDVRKSKDDLYIKKLSSQNIIPLASKTLGGHGSDRLPLGCIIW